MSSQESGRLWLIRMSLANHRSFHKMADDIKSQGHNEHYWCDNDLNFTNEMIYIASRKLVNHAQGRQGTGNKLDNKDSALSSLIN